MAASHFMVAAAVTAALTGTASAQTAASSKASSSAQISTSATTAGATRSHWLAGGFVGTTTGISGNDTLITNTDEHGIGYGGHAGYLWRGVVGGEFLADFSPTSSTSSFAPLLQRNGSIDSFMGNLIGAYPLGSKGQYQPYVSGGWGRVSANADVLIEPDNENGGIDRLREFGSGTNIGGGLMAFANHVGVRSDLRWYHGSTNTNLPPEAEGINVRLAQELLSGLEFFRFNAGLALRW